MDEFEKERKKVLTVTINAKFILITTLYLVLIGVLVFDIIDLYNLDKLANTLNSKVSVTGVFEFIFRVLFEILIVATIHYVAYKKIPRNTSLPSSIAKQEIVTNATIAKITDQPLATNTIKDELPQVFYSNECKYQKCEELANIHIVGYDWAGNKERAATVMVGERLFFEKREPSIHGANGVAVLTETGGLVGFLAKNLQDIIMPLIETETLFLIKAENSPLTNIAIGFYKIGQSKDLEE